MASVLSISNLKDGAFRTNLVKTLAMTKTNANQADEIMCECSGTTRGKIQILFEQGMDMDAISRWAGAVSGCGGCEWDIAEYLNTLTEQKK